jgi:hypothetical protein
MSTLSLKTNAHLHRAARGLRTSKIQTPWLAIIILIIASAAAFGSTPTAIQQPGSKVLAAPTLASGNGGTNDGSTGPHHQPAVLDFDGDHKTDIALTRGVVGGSYAWYILGSTTGFSTTSWGKVAFDVYVPGDYDGDGKWDIAVWRPNPGVFYILQSATNSLRVEYFGTTGDDPTISQDFDRDGKTDPAVVRRQGSVMVWYIQRSLLGFTAVTFGDGIHDRPIRGDYDGDRKADIVVYRTNTGSPANTFFVLPSSGGPVRSQQFGDFIHDSILPADFDGDGKTDYAVFRSGAVTDTGVWYWIRSTDGALATQAFGNGQIDFAVPGDYDGDGTTDHAVWRWNGTPTFYQLGSASGFKATVFGLSDDEPVAFYLQVRN